jgi:hypothetical protein
LASKPNELKKLLWPISNTQKSRVNSQWTPIYPTLTKSSHCSYQSTPMYTSPRSPSVLGLFSRKYRHPITFTNISVNTAKKKKDLKKVMYTPQEHCSYNTHNIHIISPWNWITMSNSFRIDIQYKVWLLKYNIRKVWLCFADLFIFKMFTTRYVQTAVFLNHLKQILCIVYQLAVQ